MSTFTRSLLLMTFVVAFSEALPVLVDASDSLQTRSLPQTILSKPENAEFIGWIRADKTSAAERNKKNEFVPSDKTSPPGSSGLEITDEITYAVPFVPNPSDPPTLAYFCAVYARDFRKWRQMPKVWVNLKDAKKDAIPSAPKQSVVIRHSPGLPRHEHDNSLTIPHQLLEEFGVQCFTTTEGVNGPSKELIDPKYHIFMFDYSISGGFAGDPFTYNSMELQNQWTEKDKAVASGSSIHP